MNTPTIPIPRPRQIGLGEKIKVFYDDLVEDLGDIYDDIEVYIDGIWTNTKNFIYSSNPSQDTADNN